MPRGKVRLWIGRLRIACLATGALLIGGACHGDLPSFEIGGDAAHVVRFSDWEPVVIGGKVVKWTGAMERLSDEPIGSIRYELVAPDGRRLSDNALDYRSSFSYRPPFEVGDVLPVSIAAYRGDPYGNEVASIRLTVAAP